LFSYAKPGGYGSYPPPMDGDWVITNETLVVNETIVMNGNLTIENGGNLTLRNVTLKMDCAENGNYHIEVMGGGAMHIAEGSNITSNTPDGKHRFNFWVREGAKFEMKDSELHECGYYVDYEIFETQGLYIETDLSQISNSIFSNNYEAMVLNNSNYSNIVNCSFQNNSGGIEIVSTENNLVSDCLFTQNDVAIGSFQSNNNSIVNCEFIDNWFATYFLGFTNATFVNNSFLNNRGGLSQVYPGSIMRNNTFLNNTINLILPDFGFNPDDKIDIDTSNTINGAPVYYFSNLRDMEISLNTGYEEIGYLAIVNSENISINNLTLRNNGQGLLLVNTTHSKIDNVSFFDNARGIVLVGSSYIQINDCNFINDWTGILLIKNSDNNTIQNCQIINNSKMGIWLSRSSNNAVNNCNISEGKFGIWIGGGENNTIKKCNITHQNENGTYISSNRNKIYYNNFISNGIHAFDRGSENQWDDGKVGGNYWDDYEGLDDGSNGGTAGDGIGDTNLPHLGLDHYPFMEKDGWLNYIPTDTDNDGISDIMDIDDDNDGYNDSIEVNEGTDPLNPASVPDDYDKDFIPDSMDPDIDGDGFLNEDDAYPYDKDKWRIEEEGANWNIVLGAMILLTIGMIILGSVITWLGKKKKED
jgi:parallel beta-helix repeat protein